MFHESWLDSKSFHSVQGFPFSEKWVFTAEGAVRPHNVGIHALAETFMHDFEPNIGDGQGNTTMVGWLHG